MSFLDWWSDVIIIPAKNGSKWLQLHGIVCTNRKEAQLSVGVVCCILVLSGSEGKIPRGLSKMFLIFPVVGHVSQQRRNLIQIPKHMIKWLKIYLTLEHLIHRFKKKKEKTYFHMHPRIGSERRCHVCFSSTQTYLWKCSLYVQEPCRSTGVLAPENENEGAGVGQSLWPVALWSVTSHPGCSETYQSASPEVLSICWLNLPNLLVSSTGRA